MSALRTLALAAALLAAPLVADEARAGSGFSFGYYGPGVSFHIGRSPYYYRHYRPYYYRRDYYRPYVRRPSRCGHWSRRCAENWGYGGPNYRGCLDYHGCR